MKTEASYHQERLWFIDRFEAGYLYESNPVYHNVPLILEIKGTVDLSLLERCIRDIAARHEVLRTRIETKDNRPVQVIETEPAVELEDMEAVWGFVNRPMRLDERLMRVGVQQLAEGRYLLCVVFHHAICDRYSLELFTGELLTVYGAYVEGREPGLPEPGFQYGDFSQWQRELPEDTLESFLFYWKGKLRDGVEPLELPTDSQRLAVHVFHAARRDFGITPGVTEKAKNLARRRGVDVGVVLMAAFKVLLHKYTGQQEIVIGTAAANREMEGLERVMGPVANLLVLPGTVKPGSNFLEILSVLGRDMDEVYRYGAMPFDRLAVELNPRKDMSRTVFFDVVFEYGEAVPEIPAIKGIESVKVVETNLGWGKYDLNLWVRDEKNGFSAVLVYNGDYYKESTITRLTDHYQRLLERLVSEPHQRVSDISALSDEEKRQLVVDLNDTAADYPKDKTIHQLFEEQAAKTPDRIAVTYRSYRTHMTYSRLNRASDHLAAILQKKGVMPDTIVGIKMERSLEMIIGILGILKAGGAYMPIDPDYPEERIDFMLKDSGATLDLTLTHPPPAGHPRRGPSNALSRGDLKDWEHLGKSPLERGARRVGCVESAPCPANLAYVIYTSGTTGKPKGSLITHRNVVRLMKNDRFQFDFNERDVWTLFHSFCFDFSVWEMYGALLYGGSVVVVPRMTARSTGDFLELLHSSGVTVLCQTPPAFYNLAREELSRGDAASLALRYVIFGGDMLHPPRLKEWREKYPATRLINMYGITETTVHVTFKEITETEIAQPTSNIGRPIPTLAAYVVDPHDELVPIGVPGELLVGGDGVCRGYLNRPELTNQKFFGGSRGAAFQKSPPGK
ncbi:MAG: amino acid adenylation domain-containing protein, partial [bacterium]|nr:amino acid adenylation domain-containing protein [bacterium]